VCVFVCVCVRVCERESERGVCACGLSLRCTGILASQARDFAAACYELIRPDHHARARGVAQVEIVRQEKGFPLFFLLQTEMIDADAVDLRGEGRKQVTSPWSESKCYEPFDREVNRLRALRTRVGTASDLKGHDN